MKGSRSWVPEYAALLADPRLAMPSSARGCNSGGLTGYAQGGGPSAPRAVEESDANESARIEMNVFTLFSPRAIVQIGWFSRGFQNGRKSSIFGQRFITTFRPPASASRAAS